MAKSKTTLHPALAEAQALLDRKSLDYNGTVDVDTDPARREYFPYGAVSYMQMIHTKVTRLESVLLGEDRNVNFESARDSAIDLINYAAFLAAFLELDEE